MSDCCETTIAAEYRVCDEGIDVLDDSPTASVLQTHPLTRRDVLKYMGGFVLTGFLAACGQTGTGGSGQRAEGELRKLDLAFCSQVLCVLPFEVAKQQGYFAAEGYDVNLVYMKGGTQAISALQSGSVDFVGTPMDLVVRSTAEGKPVKMVASTSRLPFFALVTAPGTADAIESIGDLADKKVGVGNLGTTDDLLLTALATKNDVDPDSIERVALGPNISSALLRGQVDAAMVQEPSLTLVSDAGGRVLMNFMDLDQTSDVLGGAYQFMGLNTRPEVLEARGDTARALARSLAKANAWILAHSGEEIVQSAPDELVSGDNLKVFADALDEYKESLYPADARVEEANVERVVEAQKQSGLLEEDVEVAALFTNEYLED